ncbi:MAG: M6 family metalloprotease domain-containing protein [Candidatus Eisenbacteria bacterium]|nr:M6 family metalloprotease domain-containing protein [Candidatus Eisenbacteria bacterium]
MLMNRSSSVLLPLLVLLALVVMAVQSGAAPLWGEVVDIREPDGRIVKIRVWGDEFYSVGETLDGYTVVRDESTGLLSYAELSADGRSLVSTGVAVNESPLRSLTKHVRIPDEAAAEKARAARLAFETMAPEPPERPRGGRGTSTGAVEGITLIIDFSDDSWTIPPSNIDDYCNQLGYTGYGNNGSVRDYFSDVSEGLLDYTNYVPGEYYRAANTKAYYCSPSAPYGERARELVIEALTDLDNKGFDFSQYDSDGDGIIDAINCFYAGDTWNAWAEGLWPHASSVSFFADGVQAWRYQISNLGSSLRLGTFCHENGHMLMGWPDLYDYGGNSSGVGQFCVMCSVGPGTNPIEPCAWMKYVAGWGDVTVLSSPAEGLMLSSDGNVMHKFEHPSLSNEYYLVENRQRTGRDAALPDHGMAVWHVDTEGDNSNEQQTPELHYLVTLVQADGDWDLENHVNYGDGSDLYAGPGYPACTPDTYPNTNWWDGSASGAFFSNISASGPTMTYDFYNASYTLGLSSAMYATEVSSAGSAQYTATLKNWNAFTDTVTVDIAQEFLPDGVLPTDWVASYREPGGVWMTDPAEFVLASGEEKSLEVRMLDNLGTATGMAVTTLSATGLGDVRTGASVSFATFVDIPSILLVDDDNFGDLETHLQTALLDTGYAAHTWDAGARGRPTLEQLSAYSHVLWTTGAGDAAYLTSGDEQNLMDYLDQGGSLLLTSTEFLNSRALPNEFVQDYLHIDSWACDNSGFTLTGVAGDPITNGMSLSVIGGPVPPACSDALTISAPAEPILTTAVGDKALRVEENGHKIVFMAFPFENVKVDGAYPNNQKTLIARTIGWFEGVTGIDDEPLPGDRLALRQNAPNPFNPTTRIAFSVPSDADRVQLRVYNVRGQVVRTLVDGVLEPGPHSVVWDGRSDDGIPLASGIYFSRIETGQESVTRKMALLK